MGQSAGASWVRETGDDSRVPVDFECLHGPEHGRLLGHLDGVSPGAKFIDGKPDLEAKYLTRAC